MGIFSLLDIEVQLPTCISTHFIEPGIEGVLKYKLSAGIAVAIDNDMLALHKVAVGRKQLHIQ